MKLRTEVDLGPGHIVVDGDRAPPPERGTDPQFSAYVRCGQMAGRIKMPLGREVGLGPACDIVLDGNPAPAPKRGHSSLPHFSISIVAKRLDGSRCHLVTYEGRPRTSPYCVRWDSAPTAPPPKKGAQPQFSAHICCGQTAGWVKIPLGTKVGLGPGRTVLGRDPAPPKGAQLPIFGRVYCGQTVAHLSHW